MSFAFLSDEANARIHRVLRLCDRPDRWGARLYVAVRSDCGCCTFYRGVALGMIFGIIGGGFAAAAF